MVKIRKRVGNRNSHGATIAAVALAAFFIILPLGLIAFEVARVYMAQAQLQNAVDSSALAAVAGLASGDVGGDEAIQSIGLTMFRRNHVTSVDLKPATLTPSVHTDNPVEGASEYFLTQNTDKGQVQAEGCFGYRPAFAVLLNLGTFTLRAGALAGNKSVQGDIVIAVDISDSIKGGCGVNNQPDGTSSKSVIALRHTNAKGTVPKFTYTTVTRQAKGGAPVTRDTRVRRSFSPTGLHVGGNFLHAIPDPTKVPFGSSKNQVYVAFAGKSLEEKTALLVESKQGHLNDLTNPKKFDPANKIDKNKIGDTILGKYLPGIGDGSIPAGPDYRAAYEEVALPFVHPLADEKRDVATLVALIAEANPDAEIALVGFAPKAGGHFKNPPKAPKGQPPIPPNLPQNDAGAFGASYGYGQSCLSGKNGATEPYVRFTKDRDLIIQSANICTTFEGTNTTDALNVSHALLTENQRNLKGRPQACFLLTDGIPTVGGYIKAAKKFGKDGIPIKVIGYSHIGYSHRGGPKVCVKIAQNGGPGSRYIPAPYKTTGPGRFTGFYKSDEDNRKALLKAFTGAPVLVSD